MNNRWICSLIILLSSFAGAQQCSTSVLVNAFDAKTKTTLRGLRSSDFTASAGHESLSVASVRPVFRNRVLVLLDVSAAADSTARATLLQNTMDYINQAPQGMPVAFGAFAEHVVFTANFSNDPESLSSSLQSTIERAARLTGQSHLPNALPEAISLFGHQRPGDTILLISNGDGHISKRQWSSLAREFSRRDIRIQLLMNAPVNAGDNASSMFAAFAAADHINPSLVKLANLTGGVLMGFMNSEWFNAAASGYLLDVRRTQNPRPKNWHLRVRNYDEEFGVEPVLFYPRQLPACSVPLIASSKQHGEG